MFSKIPTFHNEILNYYKKSSISVGHYGKKFGRTQ